MEELGQVGDYYKNFIIAKDTGNPIYNEIILIHEFLEYYLISRMGLTAKDIDEIDEKLEGNPDENRTFWENQDRRVKKYLLAHDLATFLEKQICTLLGIDYTDFEKALEETSKGRQK